MPVISSARRGAAALAVLAVLAVAVLAVALPTAQKASAQGTVDPPLPYRHSTCDFSTLSLSKADGWQRLMRDPLRIRPSSPGKLLVTVSADANVSSGAELRIGYRYNGGNIEERFFGPGNFANHSEFAETRTTTAVVSHNGAFFYFDPYVRVNGPNGKTASAGARCIAITHIPSE